MKKSKTLSNILLFCLFTGTANNTFAKKKKFRLKNIIHTTIPTIIRTTIRTALFVAASSAIGIAIGATTGLAASPLILKLTPKPAVACAGYFFQQFFQPIDNILLGGLSGGITGATIGAKTSLDLTRKEKEEYCNDVDKNNKQNKNQTSDEIDIRHNVLVDIDYNVETKKKKFWPKTNISGTLKKVVANGTIGGMIGITSSLGTGLVTGLISIQAIPVLGICGIISGAILGSASGAIKSFLGRKKPYQDI